MGNVIGGQKGTPYFQLPDSLVRSGDLRDLSGSALKYYVFLCQQMNQTGGVELEYTNQTICHFAGIKDHKTAQHARTELLERGRIKLRPGPSGGYIHVMLSDSGEVFPPAKGRKAVRYHVRQETGGTTSRRKERTSATVAAMPPAEQPAPPAAPRLEQSQPAIRATSEPAHRIQPSPQHVAVAGRTAITPPCRYDASAACYLKGCANFEATCRKCEHRTPAQTPISPATQGGLHLTADDLGFN